MSGEKCAQRRSSLESRRVKVRSRQLCLNGSFICSATAVLILRGSPVVQGWMSINQR